MPVICVVLGLSSFLFANGNVENDDMALLEWRSRIRRRTNVDVILFVCYCYTFIALRLESLSINVDTLLFC